VSTEVVEPTGDARPDVIVPEEEPTRLVEPGGIEHVPDSIRHGRPLQLFWTWSAPNFSLPNLFLGVTAMTITGAPFSVVVSALLLGTLMGCVMHGFLSTWGPRYGVPQMVHSRGAFGYRGNAVPAVLDAAVNGIGWYAVNSITGSLALGTLVHLPFVPALALIVLVQTGIACVGHDLIHRVERFIFPFMATVYVLAAYALMVRAHPLAGVSGGASAHEGSLSAFITCVFLAFSVTSAWAIFAMDYARYLPADAPPSHVFWSAAGGLAAPFLLMQIAGACLATIPGTTWGPNDSPTDQFAHVLPAWLGTLALIGALPATIGSNVLNAYSGAMALIAAGLRLPVGGWQRAGVAVVVGLIGGVLSLWGQHDQGSRFETFLLLGMYWFTPFMGVVLIDYCRRGGAYDLGEFYDTARNPRQGLVTLAVATAVTVPFWNQSLYKGAFAQSHPQFGDLSFAVGLLAGALLFAVLPRPTATS
jgi:purine-cytosine permease-like protein